MLDATGVHIVCVSQSSGLYFLAAASMQKVEKILIDWFMIGTPNSTIGVRGEEARFQDHNVTVGHPAAQSGSHEASVNVTLYFCLGIVDL